MFREDCGLPLNTYFSMVKMMWFLKNVPAVKAAKERGDLKMGTVDSWLVHKLTGNKEFMTDSSNASRTMLMDINQLEWSDKMLKVGGLEEGMLP
jgi:glycerol kinase